MEKEDKNKCGFCSCICRFFGKVMLFIAFMAAVSAALLRIVDFLKGKKNDEENPGRDIKEYWNLLNSKDIVLSEDNLSGVMTRNVCGATNIDLSGSSFKNDAFISLHSLCSAVSIIVPDTVNVKLDGIISASDVKNDAEDIDDSLPTLYIASTIRCSSVWIRRQES